MTCSRASPSHALNIDGIQRPVSEHDGVTHPFECQMHLLTLHEQRQQFDRKRLWINRLHLTQVPF